MNKNLLFEIGVEELPSSYMLDLEKNLNLAFSIFLTENYFSYTRNQVFITPRRMVFLVEGISSMQEIPVKFVKGPSIKIALSEEGKETEALKGFLTKCHAAEYTVKDTYIYAKVTELNSETELFFQNRFPSWLLNFPFEKKMRWEEWQFIRPIRWIVAFYGSEIVNLNICGIQSTKTSRGLHGFDSIPIVSAEDYFQKMSLNQIILSSQDRKEKIETNISGKIREDILWENVNRTESPIVLEASFLDSLLNLPHEVIETVISNQLKCFPLWDENGLLRNQFLFVMNGDRDPHLVRKGYEKVITARLNDARYFFERDAAKTLINRIKDLEKITFIEKLGTLTDKTNRLLALAKSTPAFSQNQDLFALIPLSKADLTTTMVQELTELQGSIGKIYALHQGIAKEIAEAIEDHYHPRSEYDILPITDLGKDLSILDRIDTLIGAHVIGLSISSSTDPLGLRRIANGLIRILVLSEYPISIQNLVEQSFTTYEKINHFTISMAEKMKNFQEFYLTRLKSILSLTYRYDIVNAIVRDGFINPFVAKRRCESIQNEIVEDSFKTLCDTYTRIKNITKEKNPGLIDLDPSIFQKEEEKEVWNVMQSRTPITSEFSSESYDLKPLYRFNDPITRFFETILVMDEDLNIRKHRLQLLYLILVSMKQFADFSKIVFDGGDIV